MGATARPEFRLRGWHVLLAVIAFFGAITAVNAVMITLALKSFPGEEQKKSYLQGLNYNDVLEARANEAALGWRAEMVDGDALPAGETRIRVRLVDSGGVPLRGLVLGGVIGRPATDRADRPVTFEEYRDGIYVADITGLEEGNWDLDVVAQGSTGRQLTLEKRLWLITE